MSTSRPVLMTVDDDPQVLRSIERDLRKKYAENYRVTRAQSGAEGLDLLRQLLDLELMSTDPEIRHVAEAARVDASSALPIVILEDGTILKQPEPFDLASKIGLSNRPSEQFYDLTIIGGGPGGLAAAVYGA